LGTNPVVLEFTADIILELNRVRPGLRSAFVDSCDHRSLVSWILYAFGPEGRGIKDATALAVTRLAQKPGEATGAAYGHLADLPPRELQNILKQAIHREFVSNFHCKRVFSNLMPEVLQELSERLFGQ